MKEIDCLGDMCPLPILKLREEIKKGTPEIMIITDHSCVAQSMKDFIPHLQLYYEIVESIPGIWEITVYNK